MKLTPKTEEECNQFSLLEPGIYDFRVISAEEKVSSSGNDMIQLKLIIWDNQGKTRTLTDFLLESMAYKLRHFCECSGLLDKYNSGLLLSSDCEFKEGKIKIGIQKGKENPNGGMYSDKNDVKDYIVSEAKIKQSSNDPLEEFNDVIPF